MPALTPYWESVTLPGIFFAGNATQASLGVRKHGVASLSSMVCGFRYNARLLAGHIAETMFGRARERRRLEPEEVVPFVVDELNDGPELAIQKGYLARAVRADGDGGLRDEGVLPLEVFVDAKYDGAAATLEFDDDERICPVLYVRSGGELREHVLPRHPLRRYDGPDTATRSRTALSPRSCPSSSCLARPCLGSDPGHVRPGRCGSISRSVAVRAPRSCRWRGNDRHAFGTSEASAPAMSGVRPRPWLERTRLDQAWRFGGPAVAAFGGARCG